MAESIRRPLLDMQYSAHEGVARQFPGRDAEILRVNGEAVMGRVGGGRRRSELAVDIEILGAHLAKGIGSGKSGVAG